MTNVTSHIYRDVQQTVFASWSLATTADEKLPVSFQACANDIDKGPLCVALEEVRPDLEHGQTETSGIQLGFRLGLVKVYHGKRLLYYTPDPVKYAVLASY